VNWVDLSPVKDVILYCLKHHVFEFHPAIVTKLKPPFLKIEDYSGQYQPLVYEMESWPLPRKNCHSTSCPFESHKPHRSSRASKSKRPAPRGRSSERDVKRSPGFCDCCGQRYEDLDRVSFKVLGL